MSSPKKDPDDSMRRIMKAAGRSMSRGVRIWPFFAVTAIGVSLAALWESIFNGELPTT